MAGGSPGHGTHRASTPTRPHAMFPAEPIIFLFDGFEHKRRGVHGLLDGWELAVFLEVNAAVGAEQDVLPAPVVPIFGGCVSEGGMGAKPQKPVSLGRLSRGAQPTQVP